MAENSKSTYLKKRIYQKFKENPFIDKAIQTISQNTSYKRQFMKGDKGVQSQIINSDTGELQGQTMFVRMVELDEDKFAKIYLAELGLLWEMKKPALRVFSFVIASLIPNKDEFYFSTTKALEFTKYKSISQLNIGISQLLSLGIIAKCIDEHWYYINPLFVFNGSRVTFAKTYVKTKKIEPADPNQLEISFK